MKTDQHAAAETAETFLRLPQVLARVPVGKSTIYGWIRTHKFPKPVRLGQMTSVWRASEVSAWIAKAAAEVQS